MSWDATKNIQMDGWICLLLMFLLRAFYCIQMNPLCKLYIMEELSSRNWCIKQECGSIQRRSWSQSTSFVNEMSHNLAYQQMFIHKMVSFRNKCDFFETEARIYLKGVLITFHFLLFWYLDTLKNMFVERSTQHTSFSSRKQPANAGTERKQFTENASVALQQPILTHAHTKCPIVLSL